MNSKIIAYVITAFIVLAAVYFGSLVGTAEYATLSIYFVTTTILWYIVAGWRVTWMIAAFFYFTGFTIYQGFLMEASHLLFMMVVCASGIALFNRRTPPVPQLFREAGLTKLRICIALFLIYGFTHAVYNYVNPFSPLDYSVQNAAKGYFAAMSGLILMFWIIGGPFEFILKANWLRTLWLIASFGLVLNIVFVILLIRDGYGSDTAGDYFAKSWLYSFYIPVVNMSLNRYTLRTLAPLILFLALLLLFNQNWYRKQRFIMRMLVLMNVPICLLGSVISGGRAAILLCICFGGLALLKQKRFGFIFTGFVFAILMIIAVNFFSRAINEKAPMFIARPLQFIMIEKGHSYETIEGSDLSREHAAQAGWKEWKSHERIFWFGRSIYRHLGEDYYFDLRRQVGELEAFAYYAVRSSGVHNLYGDLVIQFGLMGAIFYTLAMIACIIYSINLYRYCIRRRMPDEISELSFFCAVSLPVLFIMQIKGGGYLTALHPLLIGIIRAVVSQVEQDRLAHAKQNADNLIHNTAITKS